MAYREYIGSRYVPMFGRKGESSTEWDNTAPYEPLTVVTYQGNSYTSRQYVPVGIPISNTDFWVQTGNYNSQIEAYRQEVFAFNDRINANAADIDNLELDLDEIDTEYKDADTAIIDEMRQQAEIVWLGDSWSTYEEARLPKNCAAQLHAKLHNYAVAAMGFIQGATNFNVQADNAIADNTVNKRAVKWVVIYGGSNDWSHDYHSDTQFQTPITQMCTKLRNAFPNAVIHIFFNPRFGYGSTVYQKINDQIKLYNYISQRVDYENIPAIAHPESSCWISKSFIGDDNVHPITSGYKYLAGYVAKCLQGGEPDYTYTNMVEYQMTPTHPEYFEGYFYQRYTNRTVEFDVYCNVKQELDDTYAMKTDSSGIFPVQLFVNPDVAQKSNQLAFGMYSADGQGDAHCAIQFNKESYGTDTIWLVRSLLGSIKVGHYFGHGKFRLFWS